MQFQWLRRLIRRHTNPIPADSANFWKIRLSVVYTILAWNAFGIILYNFTKGKGNWATYYGLPKDEGTPAQQWSQTLGIKKATVYRMSGLNVSKYEVENEFDENTNKVITSNVIKAESNNTHDVENAMQ